MYLKPETKERYLQNQKIAIVAIENVIIELKKEARPSMKHFKHIRDVCQAQLDAEKNLREGK